MSKKSILELLDQNSPNSVRVETALAATSWREVDGETYVDVLVCNGSTIPRWGAYDGDEWVGDFDQMMVLDGNHNVDDTRLKNGVNLIDSHCTYTVDGTYGITTAWWVKDNALYATFKLSPIAKMKGIADSIKNGTIKYVSVGAFILKDAWDRTGTKPVRTITLMQPYEVSLVVVPAIADAMILSLDLKLKEKLMSEVTRGATTAPAPAAPAAPTTTASAQPPAPSTETLTADQIVASITAEFAVPPAPHVTVLSASDPAVAPLLAAATRLGASVLKAADDKRQAGGTVDQIHDAIRASYKARVDALVKLEAETSIHGDLPMPTQATEQTVKQTPAQKATSLFSMPALREQMRFGKRA